MKTIIINTSKEAKNAKLDILFNAPFDRNSLLRYECELEQISSLAEVIKQALISDVDTVDRDYNLIVLVDLYEFPRGDEILAVNIYKQLVSHYIGTTLVYRLKDEFNLLPTQCAIFYADSASKSENFTPEFSNEKDRLMHKAEEMITKTKKAEKKAKTSNELSVDDCDEPRVPSRAEETPTDTMLMNLFSWHKNIKKSEFSWKIRCSVANESYLDFSKVFTDISSAIANSHTTAEILSIALNELKEIIMCNGDINSIAQQAIVQCKNYFIKIFTCKFNRDNEQNLKEGFFKVYANIFNCVQCGCIPDQTIDYNEHEIKELLVNASEKYSYFLEEENILIDFKSVSAIFERRDTIFKAHKDKVLEKSNYKNEDENKVAESIMESAGKEKSVNTVNTSKMRGIDLQFHRMVDAIFNNYDPQIIKKQNELIVQNCMFTLWEWRDRCTKEDFALLVDKVERDNIKKKIDEEVPMRNSVTFFADEHEQEYNRLIGEITSVEHRLSANKNILLDTQNTVIEYGALMKKGRRYLLSFIGAIIAIIASGIPFIYMQSAATGKIFKPVLIYLCFTLGFSFAYAVASAIYMSVINRKKLALKQELGRIKEASERDRKESIIALYHYYSETIVEANCHYLLWKELLLREKENARKGIMRNAHISYLNELKGIVDRYITMFKINPAEYTGDKSYKKLKLIGEEPYYSENNRLIYSILPETKKNQLTDDGGEELL